MAAISRGVMNCDRFAFPVDGPEPANSSCGTETAGSGPSPSSPQRGGEEAITVLVIRDLLPCCIGDFCVIVSTRLLYGKLA